MAKAWSECGQRESVLGFSSYATYCEGREGDSGPAEPVISVRVKYLEAMLPVDDLKGASRAIVSYLGYRRPVGAG